MVGALKVDGIFLDTMRQGASEFRARLDGIVDAFHQHTGARLARITPAQLRRYLDSGSSSCEHMTAENALVASAACVRGTSYSSETGSN